MLDVTALGEILIDFTPDGKKDNGNICFERNPGGAPANVLAAVSRLGGKTAFIGKVGEDIFGNYLVNVLEQHGINTEGIKTTSEAKTTLAFVQLDENGDRSFSFYRNPGADTMLEKSDVNYRLIEQSKIFHFGSLTLTDEPSRSSTVAALEHAKKSGCIISYDPNLRPALWKNAEEAKSQIISVLSDVDILKISEDELEFITGTKALETGSNELRKRYNIKLVLITRGANGCYFRLGNETGDVPTFNQVKTIDTTGAGDAFLGGFLYSVLSNKFSSIKQLCKVNTIEMVRFSNAVASICTSRRGAIPAMPRLDEVMKLLKSS